MDQATAAALQSAMGAAGLSAFQSMLAAASPALGVNGALAGQAAGGAAIALPVGQPLSGKVKAWLENSSFGFITPDNGGPDVFVHRNQLTDGHFLVQGAPVTFECRLDQARGKYTATSCTGASTAPGGPASLPGGKALGKGPGVQDNLFIAGLPMDATEEFVREIFSRYGIVQQCKVLPDQPGKNDRAALVRFADANQAKWMVENLNGNIPIGLTSPLIVRYVGDRPIPQFGSFGKAFGKGSAAALASPYGTAGVADLQSAALGATASLAASGIDQTTALNPQLLAAALAQLMPGLGGTDASGALQTGGLQQLASLQLAAGGLGAAAAAAAAALPGTATPGGLGCMLPTAGIGDGGLGAAAAATALPTTSPAGVGGITASTPSAWLEATDPGSGKTYYYDSVTREVSWVKPAELGGPGP